MEEQIKPLLFIWSVWLENLQILSDDEKKKNFDMYGTTGKPSNGGHNEKPFYDPHSGFSFFFNGMPFQNTWSKPGQISQRAYYKSVLPESYEKPYLIEIISDWCFACKFNTNKIFISESVKSTNFFAYQLVYLIPRARFSFGQHQELDSG